MAMVLVYLQKLLTFPLNATVVLLGKYTLRALINRFVLNCLIGGISKMLETISMFSLLYYHLKLRIMFLLV